MYDFKINGRIPSFFPLGTTIDTKGNLYVAEYYGGGVLKISPKYVSTPTEQIISLKILEIWPDFIDFEYFSEQKVVKRIKMPAKMVTAVTIGGPKLDTLYVTTATRVFDINKGGISDKVYTGCNGLVFKVTGLGLKGWPENKLLL